MIGIYSVKPAFQRSLEPWVDALVARHVHPDVLTYAALGISVIGGAALVLAPGAPLLLLTIPAIALARTVLNALDGLVAVRSGLARPWGEVLNELCDRLADVAVFGGLTLAGWTSPSVGAAALVAMLLTSYVGILAKAAGAPRQYGGPMGKADRMLCLSVGAVAALFVGPVVLDVLLAVVLLGALATLAGRLRSTYRALRVDRPAGNGVVPIAG
jgi:CDP-diacylglycerol--glycerol-3-phosphate 3-phosphatidyltransferase